MPGKIGCWINNCGKPLAPLEGSKEEDDFRACTDHQNELRRTLAKLRGNA